MEDPNWNAGQFADFVPYQDAVKEGEKRIIFTGPRRLVVVWEVLIQSLILDYLIFRSGKSSIERVIFHKLSPHETLFLEATHGVDIRLISNNDFLQFQTWDFGGDLNLSKGVDYMGKNIPIDTILRGCSSMVYVIDAQENDFDDSLKQLVETINVAYAINPSIHFEVFLHKVDGDLMPEESKLERQQLIQSVVASELSDVNGEILVSYYLTSIYDHSALEAFSKVCRYMLYCPLLCGFKYFIHDRLYKN
jgi:Ras-related GTP-binding protein C/D